MGQRLQMVRALVPGSRAVPKMARAPRGGCGNPGVLVVGRCRPLTGAEEREASMPPVAFYDGDGAVRMTRSSVPAGWCLRPDVNGFRPQNRFVEQPVHECGQLPLGPPATAAHLSFQTAASQTGRGGTQIAVRKTGRDLAGKAIRPAERCRDAFSDHCAKATHRTAAIE
jgi:hypothetical protein